MQIVVCLLFCTYLHFSVHINNSLFYWKFIAGMFLHTETIKNWRKEKLMQLMALALYRWVGERGDVPSTFSQKNGKKE
jgi:hypothetical protein